MQFHKTTNLMRVIPFAGAVVTLLCGSHVAQAQVNLVVNGDFSAGNTGFSTDYTLASGTVTNPGQYAITTNPSQYTQDGFTSYGDHTTGTGNMLLLDGAASASSRGWYETLSLTANKVYNYSFWVASADASSPATVTFSAAATQIGSAFSASSTPGVWQQVTGTFNSGTGGSVVVAINDTNTTAVGNDFSVDDIKVTAAAPEPSTVPLLVSGLMTVTGGVAIRRRRSK